MFLLRVCCSQYGEWLPGERERLGPEEFSRYSKQLEIMRAMCHEFEGQDKEGEGEGEEERGARAGAVGGEEDSKQNEKIIELMHQVRLDILSIIVDHYNECV